ncbi:MAG: pseudouridine synthase [Bacteroidales bacterium]|nr:pseudouridine synthase [Bacteroidales bacterium]
MSRQFNKDNSEEDFAPRRAPRRPSRNEDRRPDSGRKPRRERFGEDDEEDFGRKFTKKRFSRENDRGRKFARDRKFNRESDRDDEQERGFRREGNRGRKHDRDFDRDRQKGRDRSFKRGFRRDDDESKPKRRNVVAESEILTEIIERRKSEGRTLPRKQRVLSLEFEEKHGPVRLNKYIANAGICSRREADVLISTGAITVNGEVVTEMGHKVMPTDEVRYGDKVLQREKPVYVLLNKPKDYITTTDDERGRANVMELVSDACEERIYPVGRLDRDTTGLLLFTNDGDLTKKLTHPSSQIEKTYAVELDKPFASVDMDMLRNGVELHDGKITPDDVEYVGEGKREVGVTIHSGKNRIVRRMFESLGYEVVKLDRVVFAGLTKKDLPRGRWRFLTKNEVSFLKMLSKPKDESESEPFTR